MPELVAVSIVAIIAILAIVTVIGHGIWVLLAALFGHRAGRTCPFCHRHSTRTDRCDHCHRALGSHGATELEDLAAVERQLRRFRQNATLKPAVVDQMLQGLAAYRQRLTAPGRQEDAAGRAGKPIPQATEVLAAEILPDTPETTPVPLVTPVTHHDSGGLKSTLPPIGSAPPLRQSNDLVGLASSAHPTSTPTPPVEPPLLWGPTVPVPADASIFEVADRPAASPAPPQPEVQPARGGPQSADRLETYPAAPPSRSWTELLASFMEEKNIRWGELIGGLLVVCCSIALVISFWEHFKQNLYFQSLIFVTVSAAVFGAGLYAYHRWNLVSTGRVLLIIATLLVPLNFVIAATLSKESWSPTMAAVEVLSLAIFAWLVGLAAKVLTPHSRWLTVVGVVGNSAAVVLTAQLVTAGSDAWHFSLAAACCVGLFAVAMGGGLHQTVAEVFFHSTQAGSLRYRTQAGHLRYGPRIRFDADQALALFTMLGLTAFALAVSGGMLVERAWACFALPMLLHRLGLLLSLAALPAMAVGLTVQGGVARDAEHSGYRVAGTTVALVALGAMLVALGLAWPHPHWILAVGGLDALVLATAALRWRMPVLHAGAIAAAGLAYLTGFHYFFGHYYGDLPAAADAFTSLDLLQLSISARSGTALTGLFILFALAAEGLVRSGLRRHGRVYLGGCAVTAVAGLSLVTWHALPWTADTLARAHDALRAAILYGLYGGVSLGLAARWRRLEFAYLGVSLLAAVPLWWLVRLVDVAFLGPVWALTLAAEALVVAAIVLARSALFRKPLLHVAEALGVLSGLLVVANLLDDHSWPIVASSACLGLLWLGLAWQHQSRWRTWVASTILLAGAVHTLLWNYPQDIWQPWWTAILGHATAMLTAGLLIDAWVSHRDSLVGLASSSHPTSTSTPMATTKLRHVLGEPLEQSALVSSVLMAPAALLPPWGTSLSLAWCLLWLAAVWLVHSWRRGDASLLAAHQAALSLAAAVFAAARLQAVQPGIDVWQLVLTSHGLQTCGIALAIVSLVWVGVRIAAGAVPLPPGRFRLWADLLENPFCVDRIVRFALPVAQVMMLAVAVLPDAAQELGVPGTVRLFVAGPTAWLLWALLAATAIASLWQRWRNEETIAALLIVVAAAALIAGQFQSDLAVASALRWSLAITGLVVSVAVWQQQRSGAWCRAAGAKIDGRQSSRHTPCAVRPAAPAARLFQKSETSGGRHTDHASMVPGACYFVLLAALTWLPVLLLTAVAALVQFSGSVPPGPLEGSLFARLGPQASYLVPLLVVIVALVGHAIGQRAAGYAFAAGLVLQMAVALEYVLRTHLAQQSLDDGHLVAMIQAATIAAAAWGLACYAACRWIDLRDRPVLRDGLGSPSSMTARGLMAAQVAMAVLGAVVLLTPALQAVILPGLPWHRSAAWVAGAGAWPGWLAVLLTAAAAWWTLGVKSRHAMHVPAALGFAAGILAACCFASRGADLAPWHGYHVLQTAWTAWAAMLLAVACWWGSTTMLRTVPVVPPYLAHLPEPSRAAWIRPIWTWRVVLDVLVLSLVVLNSFVDPRGPWWSLGAVVTISVTAAISAFWLRRPAYTYLSGVLINLAGILIWWGVNRPITAWTTATGISFVDANVLSLAVGSIVWSLLGMIAAARTRGSLAVSRSGKRLKFLRMLAATRQGGVWTDADFLRGYGRRALVAGSLLLGAVVIVALGGNLFSLPPIPVYRLDWIALAGMTAAAVVLLWDRSPRLALQTLYGLAVAALGMTLWARVLVARELVWTSMNELAALTLAAAVAGWLLPRIAPLGRGLRIPAARKVSGEASHPEWFVTTQRVLVVVVGLLAAWISCNAGFDTAGKLLGIALLAGRMAGPVALMLLVVTAIVMAAGCRGKFRTRWQATAFAMGALCVSAIDWAQFDPAAVQFALHLFIGLAIGGGVMTIVARFVLPAVLPGGSDWGQLGRRNFVNLGAGTGMMLLIVVFHEVVLFASSMSIELALWEVAVVAAGLLALAAAGIAFAVNGAWDPLGRDDRAPCTHGRRQVYVYAAEIILAVLGLHLRIVRPEWFGEFLRQYWMFIVMAVAFTGAGLGEWFRRRDLKVLFLPLDRTAFVLPLLPAVGFWLPVFASHTLSLVGHSPAVWFLMGTFYAVMAVSRRSPLATVLAVATSNVGLWIALHQAGLEMFVHPQLWLIPPALASLVAEYLHRSRLSDAQRTAIRYMALSVIYVSSTSDMYIAGLGNDWRLPLALMVLAVGGVMLGILLRVRSFLYLGTTFLLVDVSSLLWYAVVDLRQAWILYVSGIVLGLAILALFAVFEKRRNDVRAAVERLRQWQQ